MHTFIEWNDDIAVTEEAQIWKIANVNKITANTRYSHADISPTVSYTAIDISTILFVILNKYYNSLEEWIYVCEKRQKIMCTTWIQLEYVVESKLVRSMLAM